MPFRELTDGFSYVDANKLVPYPKLTAETACYWRHLTAFLFGEGGGAAELAEQKLLPELSDFCRYLRHYVLEVDQQQDDQGTAQDEPWMFVARQLIEMTSLFDLADEVGRANLAQLCKDFMSNPKIPHSFVKPLMSVFALVRPDTEVRIRDVAEVIAELRDPMRSPEEQKMEEDASPSNEDGKSSTPPAMKSKLQEEENRKKQVRVHCYTVHYCAVLSL